MQNSNLYTMMLTALLFLSIFSFSTTGLVEESSQLCYETLLDDSSEGEDKEETVEKELFTSSLNYSHSLFTTQNAKPLLHTKPKSITDTDPHFRPPIFS